MARLQPILNSDAIYKSYEERLRTFYNWPSHINFVHPEDLASSGLVYTGSTDLVRCIFCECQLDQCVEGDVPHNEHEKQSPGCPLIMLLNSTNPKDGMSWAQVIIEIIYYNYVS